MKRHCAALAITLLISGGLFADTVSAGTTTVNGKSPAKELFGGAEEPASLKPAAYGSYTKGCLAGGVMLPVDGPAWQAMRLSRNRNWGHPHLIEYLEKLAIEAQALDDWPGLLVGDLAQPRGGPMLSGHRSHQIGLDADIWMRPAPSRRLTREEREEIQSISVIKNRREVHPERWTEGHAKLIRRAASSADVARIFVNPPIKKALCEWAEGDRSWLRKIRPWWGHHYHFHVRLKCPPGSNGCKDQAAPPPGDGCGKHLAWWLSDEPYAKPKAKKKKKKPKVAKKPRPMLLADLPRACSRVIAAE